MNLLKDNWTYAKVTDFAQLLRGITYKKEESRKDLQEGYKPILRSNNIDYELNFVDLIYVPEKKIKSIQFIKEGDIIFAMSSGSKHLVGKSAQSTHNYDGSYGAFCGLLRVSDLMNKKLVGLFFKSQEYRKYISKISKGTNINNLKRDHILEINFPLAPLNEQNRIVEKIEELFSDLDKATEDLKKIQEQLKIYRQAVLKAAFEGKLTEEWRRNNPHEKNYLEKIHRSIKNFNFIKTGQDVPRRLPPLDFLYLPSLPDDWFWMEAHKICTSVRDGTHDTPKYIENGIPLITSKNLKNAKIDFNNVQFISKRDHKEIIKRSIVENDDILFGMIGTIGNPVIVTCKKEFSIKNVGLFKKNYDYIIPRYLRYWLESSKLFKILKEKDFIKGTTQKFISLGNLRILPIPLSSLEEQYEIVNEIESRLSVCDKLEETAQQSLEKIEYLRQSILKKVFEGKLVPQDPNDEPAEKLLERIKQEKEKFESNNKKRKKR